MANSKDFILPLEKPKPEGEGAISSPSAPLPMTISNKDLAIGVSIVIIAALLFWFLSRWLADHLVKRRKSPITANRAGWSLFFFLVLTVVLIVFGALGQFWTVWWFVGSIGLLMLITLLFFLVAALGS